MSASIIVRGAAALAKSSTVRNAAAGLIKKAVSVTRGGKTFSQMRMVKPDYAKGAAAPVAKAAAHAVDHAKLAQVRLDTAKAQAAVAKSTGSKSFARSALRNANEADRRVDAAMKAAAPANPAAPRTPEAIKQIESMKGMTPAQRVAYAEKVTGYGPAKAASAAKRVPPANGAKHRNPVDGRLQMQPPSVGQKVHATGKRAVKAVKAVAKDPLAQAMAGAVVAGGAAAGVYGTVRNAKRAAAAEARKHSK